MFNVLLSFFSLAVKCNTNEGSQSKRKMSSCQKPNTVWLDFCFSRAAEVKCKREAVFESSVWALTIRKACCLTSGCFTSLLVWQGARYEEYYQLNVLIIGRVLTVICDLCVYSQFFKLPIISFFKRLSKAKTA